MNKMNLKINKIALSVTLALSSSILMSGFASAQEIEQENDGTESDLSNQYLDETGKLIDLELMLNDQILIEIPVQLIKKSPDEKSCLICHKDIGDDLVFGSRKSDKNPFEKLKNLKLPE